MIESSIRRSTGAWFTGKLEFVRNPHVWAIIFIIIALTFIYYVNFFFIDIFDPGWQWLWHLLVFEYTNDIHGSLFCIPFIYAAIIFWWQGILVTWLFSMAIILPRISYYSPDVISLVINVVLLLIPLLVVLILALQRKWRETERKALAEKEAERGAYIGEIIKAQEEERQRISREIHDDTTQRLWVVANSVQKLAHIIQRDSNPQVAGELETIKDTILGISDDARRLSIALRPGILDDLGPVPAIRWLVDQVNNDGNIEAKLLLVNDNHRQLNQDIGTHLFRIAQEAITNMIRHAGATHASVVILRQNQEITMLVEDNGRGFNPAMVQDKSNRCLGLMGMRERVNLLGGSFVIESVAGEGTTIRVRISLSEEQDAHTDLDC